MISVIRALHSRLVVLLMIQRLQRQVMRIFDETGMELKLDFTDGLPPNFTTSGFEIWYSRF